MFWIWLSIIVVLIGAELNAETEHQTVRDTTTGRRQSPWVPAARQWPTRLEQGKIDLAAQPGEVPNDSQTILTTVTLPRSI